MTRAAIKHAEEELRLAIVASDVATLDRLLDDALLFVGPTGAVLGKDDDLDNHRSKRQVVTHLVTRELVVRLVGEDVAITTVAADLAGTFDGAAFAGAFRYLRTWQRSHDGPWRVVAGSVTALVTTPP